MKRSCRAIIFVIAILGMGMVLPASAAVKKKSSPPMQTHTDARAGLSFSFSKDWSLGDPNDFTTNDPDTVAQVYAIKDPYFPEVDVFRSESDSSEKGAKDFVKGTNDAKKKNKRFIKTYPLTIQNKKVEGYLAYSDDDKKKTKQLYAVIPAQGAYYEVVYLVNHESGTAKKAYTLFDQSLSDAQKIIQSMKFSPPVEDATTVYTNKDSGFTFTYPGKWTIKESADFARSTNGSLSLVTVDLPTGSVEVKDIGTANGSLDSYYENILAQYKSDSSIAVVQAGPIMHGKEQGYQLEFTIVTDTLKYHYFDTLLSHNGSNYRIGYEAKEAGYNRYLNQVKKIVRSFQFIEPDYTLDTTYNKKTVGTTFRYPSALKLIENPSGYTTFSSPTTLINVLYWGGFEPIGKPATLDEYIQGSVKRFADQGFTDIHHFPTTLGGLPAERFTGLYGGDRIIAIIALKDGKAQYFYYDAPDDAMRDKSLPMFDQMVASFSFSQ